MKKMTFKHGFSLLLGALLLLAALSGCGDNAAATAPAAPTSGNAGATGTTTPQASKVLKVAYRQSDAPMTYQGEDGNPTGVLSEIFAIAADYLEEHGYQVEYIPTSNDDLNLGVAAGDYDIGLFNAAYTPARAESFVFPKEYIGASKMLAVLRAEDADADTLAKIADKGLRAYPSAPNNGITFALEQYNEYNPDKQIKLTYHDDSATDTSYEDIVSGKYDVVFTLAAFWDARVLAEDGVYHQYQDQLAGNFVLAMKTYPVISPVTVGADPEFLALFDAAILAARTDPKTVELSLQYYGDNFLEYPYGEGW